MSFLVNLLDATLSLVGLQRIASPPGAFESVASTMVGSQTVQRTGWVGGLWRWATSSESVLPFIPRSLRYLIFLIFLLNCKSWPFVWHVKVWYPAIVAKYKARIVGARQYYHDLGLDSALNPSSRPTKAEGKAGDGTSAASVSGTAGAAVSTKKEKYTPNALGRSRIGRFDRPMGVRSVKRYNASFDDCDYNMHLSNSAYAKNLDSARMQACIDLLSPFFVPGGWMALGAAHYQYIKEIPMFADYEIRISIGGFEDKWMYLVSEFVTYPKKRSAKAGKPRKPQGTSVVPDISQPNSGTATPEIAAADGASAKPAAKAGEVREDGSVLHCFAVSTYCFKIGRLTVPPRVVLTFCGFGDPSNWERTERLLAQPDHGRAWLKEGWKSVEPAVGSEWEEGTNNWVDAIKQGRELGGRLKEGLEGLRGVVTELPLRS